MERRLLVVCTANLCRSPVAAALLARELDGVADVDGGRWIVTSAGTTPHRAAIDPDTMRAAAAVGLDLAGHRSRVIARADVDGADLVVTMTREHLRDVVADAPEAWPKTFTLRELVRRAGALGPPATVDEWIRAAGAGRRAADLVQVSADDDVADPYRRGGAANEAMVRELAVLAGDLVRRGPWRLNPLDPTAGPTAR